MFLHLQQVLTAEELSALRTTLQTAAFQDGRTTASGPARLVKNNAQIIPSQHPELRTVDALLTGALARHPMFHVALFPRTLVPFRISRYDAGMSYGLHVDGPVMEQPPVRTDISLTLFLNDPAEYDGGELVIHSEVGELSYKLAAGDAIAYPSQYLHRVADVRMGSRLVAVTWIQSAIRNTQQRDLLLKLNSLCSMAATRDPHSEETTVAFQVYSNLVRMWCDV